GRPLPVRYLEWLGNLLHGDLGRSYITNQPVMGTILHRLPVSLELILLAQIIALLIGVPLGLLAAYREHSAVDVLLALISFGMLSLPVFVLAIGLVQIFALDFGLLPAIGYVPASRSLGGNLASMALPAFAIGLTQFPFLLRTVRADVASTLREEFITLARAKGLSPTAILVRHALRPSSANLITMVGLQLGGMLSSSVVVEMIFGLPGIGQLLTGAIDTRDAMVVQGVVTFLALAYVVINMAVDALYSVVDPRIRT
uniref:ABC transporter permease n=1 Tax=Sphingomonas sp. TaxID=28214 RepID=UPI0025DD8A93